MLETARCRLDQIRPEDEGDLRGLYFDQRVRRYLGGTVDEAGFAKKVSAMVDCDAASHYWSIREKGGGGFIGLASLDPHHDGVDIELSYQLLPDRWRRGYATEVLRRIVDFAFHDLGFERIVAETQVANRGSCGLLEKVGMRPEAVIERFGETQAIYSIRRAGRATHEAVADGGSPGRPS